MNIQEDMLASYEHLKKLVDADGLPHACIAGLQRMTLEPAFAEFDGEMQYRMTLGPIRG